MGDPTPVPLGEPLRLRGVTLRNRIVGAPMERNYSDLAGRATERYAAYLKARAAGGTALLFTEASYIRQDSKARLHQAGMHDDAVLPGLRGIADAVHSEGGLLGVELNHAGRVVPSAVSQSRPVAPSPVPCTEIGGEIPAELSAAQIDEVVAAFAAAARRAVSGGADVLSVHGAHGYLIGQFLSPRSNKRQDAYASPTRFLDQVLVGVRESVGSEIPIFLRWSAFEGLPGGWDEHAALRALLKARLDLIDVVDLSAGTYGAGHWITPSGEVSEGYLGSTARRYREETGLRVSVAGRIVTPAVAADLVGTGATDMVTLARALHADPDWARHAIAGTAPRPCIYGNQGCADVIFTGEPLWCTANPRTGKEVEDAPPLLSPHGTGRVLVVGAGPAGLQAALTLAELGVSVAVRERHAVIGGQMAMAARLRAKPQFGRLLDWYGSRLAALGVDVELGAEVSGGDVVAGFVGVIHATGGTDYVPARPGPGAHRVVGIRDCLADGVPQVDAVTVWGADRGGVYLADHLASAGRRVLLVGSQRELAPDAGQRERLPAVERLQANPAVTLALGATVEEVRHHSLVLSAAAEQVVVPSEGPVIVSLGAVPRSLDRTTPVDVPTEVAGEAGGTRTLDGAIASGDRAVRRLLLRLARENQTEPV